MQVIHHLNGQLQAGTVVTCQLGNSFDSDWAPAAPVLLLHSNAVFFGDTQFTGLYRVGDKYHVAMMVKVHEDRDSHVNQTGLDVGITYCTMSREVDMETKTSRWLSDAENRILTQALFMHREKIPNLPETVRYVKLEPLPVVDGAIELAPNAVVLVQAFDGNYPTYVTGCDSPAFLAGYQAFHANKGRDTNPHAEGDVAHDQWNNGYDSNDE